MPLHDSLRPWTGEILPPTGVRSCGSGARDPRAGTSRRPAGRGETPIRGHLRFVPTPPSRPETRGRGGLMSLSHSWNEDGCDRLEHLPDAPEGFGALVWAVCWAEGGPRRSRCLSRSPRLALDAPFVCVEPNGRYAGAVVRSMRETSAVRGGGPGCWRFRGSVCPAPTRREPSSRVVGRLAPAPGRWRRSGPSPLAGSSLRDARVGRPESRT